MRFVLRMAGRETRAAWARLLFFFLCLAIGVGAIVTLRSVIQSVRGVLSGEARNLIAADLLLTSARGWPDDVAAEIERHLAASGGVLDRTEGIEVATMVRPADEAKAAARMVELRGVEPAFPLYGRVELAGGEYSPALLAGRGAVVRQELLLQLGLEVGDEILIGERTFTIRGVLRREPGSRVGGFSLGPRVLVDLGDLRETGLLAFGSRARHQIMLRVAPDRLDALHRALRTDLRREYVNVRSWRTTESDVGDDLERAENYLSLVGLVILVLGGIGVSSVTRVFVEQKLKSIAVLKCVGASGRQVLGVYLVQILGLGLGGSLLGVGLAAAAVAVLPRWVSLSPQGYDVAFGLTLPAVLQGAGTGLLVALLFALVPLLRVRLVRPSLLLRQDAGPSRRDPVRYAVAVVVGAALVALAAWQAGSLRIGLVVAAGFLGITAVLAGAAWLLVRAARPLARSRSFVLRHAALHIDRPGSQTRLVLMAVGLGCFFIVGVRALQVNLLDQVSLDVSASTPDLFLIDIQQDQAAPVRAFLNERAAAPPRLLPVLRARVTAVHGRDVTLAGIEDVRGRGGLGREYTITYRDTLEANETIVEGRFWDEGPQADGPEVSIEHSLTERHRIHVGDRITFDVLGRSIEARVTSVRQVDWRDARAGGFIFVFRPDVLENAPHAYIAPVRGPADPAARARLQRDLVAAFPNVSAVDLREVIETARGVVESVALAVSVVGGLVLFTGLLILTGAVAMTKFRRVYEAAILKTLGASSRLVGSLLLTEYGVLGVMAGLIGASGGAVLAWVVSRQVFDIPWTAPWVDLAAGVVLTGVLVAVVGVLASVDVLRKKPLATLRAE